MGAQLPSSSLPFIFFLSFALSFLLNLFPPLLSATAKRFGEYLNSSDGFGRSLAAKRHLVHFELKTASVESNFRAVPEIAALAHKTQAFRWRK